MKKLIIFTVIFNVVFSSCSTEDSTQPINSSDLPIETFGSWSPPFTNQTSNFTQTRNGSQGNSETRTISVSFSSQTSSTTELNLNLDYNNDGDLFDDLNEIITTYSASNDLGSFQQTSYEVTRDVNNQFQIGENVYRIGSISGYNYQNLITCEGVPSFFNHEIVFRSLSGNEDLEISLYNNSSSELKISNYDSSFIYFNDFFEGRFTNDDELYDHIDDMSNDELYSLYLTSICNNSAYRLIDNPELRFDGFYEELNTKSDFHFSITLIDETYTISMTGRILDFDNPTSSPLSRGTQVSLFYIGSLSFDDESDDPFEINSLLNSVDDTPNSVDNTPNSVDDNPNSSENYSLNVLYDSKYNPDGTIKTEESEFSEWVRRKIDTGKLFSFRTDSNYGYGQIPVSEYNSNTDTFNKYNITYYPYYQNDLNYFTSGYDKIDHNFENIIEDFTINQETVTQGLGPQEYFTRTTHLGDAIGSSQGEEPNYYSKEIIDNTDNIYLAVLISGQDPYGDNYNSRYIVKYDMRSNTVIWLKEIPAYYTGHHQLNQSQDKLILYGERSSNGTSYNETYVIIFDAVDGEIEFNETLSRFSNGRPMLLGFYEDTDIYLFYGPYIVTSKIDKTTLNHSTFYTEEDNFNMIFCTNVRAQVRGIEKFNDNYLFLNSIPNPSRNYRTEETYNIVIRDQNGTMINSYDLRNNMTGKPYGLYKVDENTFVGYGQKNHAGCNFNTGYNRLIKFNLELNDGSSKKVDRKTKHSVLKRISKK